MIDRLVALYKDNYRGKSPNKNAVMRALTHCGLIKSTLVGVYKAEIIF